jgi:ATPase family associated with various cellular activities (AAA)
VRALIVHTYTQYCNHNDQVGNPGTGKTTVAKLYAGILRDLGLLSKGDAVFKAASDFVGSVLGASESATRAILKAAEGCVCVIGEAYALHSTVGGAGVSGSSGDPYRTAVIDTIVEQVTVLTNTLRHSLLTLCTQQCTTVTCSHASLLRTVCCSSSAVHSNYHCCAITLLLAPTYCL